jgi:hypothetical protein
MESFYIKRTRLTPEELRKFEGNEHYTDAEAEEIIDSLVKLSLIGYSVYKEQEDKIKDSRIIHEAGHVFAALHYGFSFKSSSINDPLKKRLFLSTKELKSKVSKLQAHKRAVQIMMVDCAGVVAERRYFGKFDKELSKDDLMNIHHHSKYLTGEKNEVILNCYKKVDHLFKEGVSQTKYWSTVIEIAEELERKKEITYDKALEIYNKNVLRPIGKQSRK